MRKTRETEGILILVILFDLDSDLKQRFMCSYFVFVVCFGAHDVMNKSYLSVTEQNHPIRYGKNLQLSGIIFNY